MKVFGIGLNKTGTTTLGQALRELGFRHKTLHSVKDFGVINSALQGDLSPLCAVARQFDSFEDWPWPLVYRQLDREFPGSKFVLTLRSDAETWYESLCKHAVRVPNTRCREAVYGVGDPSDHREHLLRFYEEHRAGVLEYFQGRQDDLLVACWEDGDAWGTLCPFVGANVPAKAFPHANRSPDRVRRRE